MFGGAMAHYFTNDNLDSNIQKLNVKIFDINFTFYTDNGVFSKDRLDFGTRTFLENIPIDEMQDSTILDVGCGYGPIGIILSKLTSSKITMIDVNRRALHLAERNIKENKVTDIRVMESDCYSQLENEKFDYILTNPPIHAGKEKVYEIVMNARYHLEENGTLFIVIRKDQGAKSMMKDLVKYYTVEVIAKNKGFFIISCKIS